MPSQYEKQRLRSTCLIMRHLDIFKDACIALIRFQPIQASAMQVTRGSASAPVSRAISTFHDCVGRVSYLWR
jgi:hypothetical protein